MQMHAQQPDQGFDAAALQASERARARSLLDILVEAHADVHEGTDPKLIDRERSLQQRLRARSQHQVELLSRPHTPEQEQIAAKELETLTSAYEDVEAQIRANSPRYAALTQPVPLDLKQIQEQVLDSETLLLEYALGEDRSYMWAVTNSTLVSYSLPKRGEIEPLARDVYELLTARNVHPKGEGAVERDSRIARALAEYPAAAARLSEMLLGPVATQLGHKRLVIVTDGVLQYIPFAALPAPKQDKITSTAGQPLAVQSEVVAAPSASVIGVLRREIAGRSPVAKLVAVLADPVFDNEDPRVSNTRQISQIQRMKTSAKNLPVDLERSWIEIGGSEHSQRIPRLLFSRREAESITRHAPPNESFEAVDFQASRTTVTSPELAKYRIIHFATHGMVDSHTPALSGIVLSLVDQQGRPQDGFLRLWDIYNLRLPADLVVLSACRTALGKEVRGEGLISLTRGFMYAGAARVMASLWQVDDAATSEFMSQFYQGVLKKNLAPAAALQAAQVYMWKQKRWQGDPYYWAAFQLQGEWK
jgi:CHAT domain-containing protein